MVNPVVAVALGTAVEASLVHHIAPQYFVDTTIRTVLLLLAVNTFLFAFFKIHVYPFYINPLRHLPTPKGGAPILGHGLAMFEKPPAKLFSRWMAEIPNEGIIHFHSFFNRPRLLLTNAKALSEVLVQKSYNFEKPAPVRNFLRRILGDGLVVVEGDEHRFQRKHAMPSFSFRHIKDLYPMMWTKATSMVDRIAQDATEQDDGSIDIGHWATKATLDMIGIAGLGRNFDSLSNADDPLAEVYDELTHPSMDKLVYFASQIVGPSRLINMFPLKVNKRITDITDFLREECLRLVRSKAELMKNSTDPQVDILSLLLQSNDFSESQLVDQLLTFLAAGHETTSSAFTWTTYLLAKHPSIQSQLRAEIHAALPTNPAIDSSADLARTLESLPLLNGVCNETLRIYPTVPTTVRVATADTTVVGQPIPKGTEIMLSPWAINRATHLWGSDAAEYNPSRWITDGRPNNNGGAPSNYALLTFLHGPRSCIGSNFAKAELRCLTAAFVGAFEFEMVDPTEEVVPSGAITIKPRDGLRLKVKPVRAW